MYLYVEHKIFYPFIKKILLHETRLSFLHKKHNKPRKNKNKNNKKKEAILAAISHKNWRSVSHNFFFSRSTRYTTHKADVGVIHSFKLIFASHQYHR